MNAIERILKEELEPKIKEFGDPQNPKDGVFFLICSGGKIIWRQGPRRLATYEWMDVADVLMNVLEQNEDNEPALAA